ncbi:gluconate:H+ symporter [Patulibacter sp. SYSU D01012]|uniref:GntT/GntP/DsdX family permease n=1 Tax=Patulibacter sp. SYSU D01012 TaxID=2817381 RepID=UPI001B31238B
MWTQQDTLLVLWALVAIALVIVLVARLRLHAFPALMIGALAMGLLSGIGTDGGIGVGKLVDSFEGGAGDTLGQVGLLVALGTMLGALLSESGGADQIASTVLDRAGDNRVPWAMAVVAMIVGIPLFFEIGVVLLIPIIFTVARRLQARRHEEGLPAGGNTYLLVGIPALAGLSVLHGLVPPHPGPLTAISTIDADLGTTMIYGFIVAIPTVIIAGPLFARMATHWAHAEPPEALVQQVAREPEVDTRPSFGLTLFTILLPVALMLVRTVADVALDEGDAVRKWADFVGNPVVALLVGVLVAMWTFGFGRGFDREKLSSLMGNSLAPAASILLIIGAGGGFKGVLVDSGIGDAIAKGVENAGVSALILGWLVAVLIRLATGSATVATVTAAGIMAPLVAHDAAIDRPLLALAIGAGSLFFSHVNDAGFWLINQYFGMSVKDTIKTWSVMETIISVCGLIGVLLLSLVV